jgi:hypothetical protein
MTPLGMFFIPAIILVCLGNIFWAKSVLVFVMLCLMHLIMGMMVFALFLWHAWKSAEERAHPCPTLDLPRGGRSGAEAKPRAQGRAPAVIATIDSPDRSGVVRHC